MSGTIFHFRSSLYCAVSAEPIDAALVFSVGCTAASVSFDPRLRRIAKNRAANTKAAPRIDPTAIPAFAPPLNLLPPFKVTLGDDVAWRVIPVGVELTMLLGVSNSEAVTLKQTSLSVNVTASTYVWTLCQSCTPSRLYDSQYRRKRKTIRSCCYPQPSTPVELLRLIPSSHCSVETAMSNTGAQARPP
jgi:hypothetical protein